MSASPGSPAPAEAPALRARIVERLRGTVPSASIAEWRIGGLPAADTQRFLAHLPEHPIPAAVLVPLIDHAQGLTVLLTQRAERLKNHAGQISFPGGRIEASDRSPLDAALREAHEEIGLDAGRVHPIGYLPDHLIITGYRVTPVVAFVDPGFALRLDEGEVTEAFEVPLAHVFDIHNHVPRARRIGDREVRLYDIPWEHRHIWGATAGMLITLYDVVTGGLDES
ncbi:MAG: CoA pyrophosphatase [Steroidobacteraceae bacterium]